MGVSSECQVMAQGVQQLLLVGLAQPWTLPWELLWEFVVCPLVSSRCLCAVQGLLTRASVVTCTGAALHVPSCAKAAPQLWSWQPPWDRADAHVDLGWSQQKAGPGSSPGIPGSPWPQSWHLNVQGEVTGALGPGKARGTEGSQFELVIGKKTVFSGRWHWTEG